MKRIVASLIIVLGLLLGSGVLWYVDSVWFLGRSGIEGEFHQDLPEEALVEPTAIAPMVESPEPLDAAQNPEEIPSPTPTDEEELAAPSTTIEVTPPIEVETEVDGAVVVNNLFTNAGVVGIVVRQISGTPEQLFDLIPLSSSLGPWQEYEVRFQGASLQLALYTGESATQIYSQVVDALQPMDTVQVASLSEPYGDAFSYINVTGQGNRVRGLLLLEDHVYGFMYDRAVHGTIVNLLNAYK